ncbi:MAG: hypothetical protein U0514_01130 [Candidatus Andersenbacteria bacterium]
MAAAKKVGTNLLILWIAAGVVLGAGAMYLVQLAFPGTFVTFRGGSVTSQTATTTTPTTTTSNATGQNPNLLTNQPLKSVTMKDVVLTNSGSGGTLTFDLFGETIGTKLVAESATITQLDESFVQGFSNPPTQQEVQALLGGSISAINERAKTELGATELRAGELLRQLVQPVDCGGGKTFAARLDEFLGGNGDGGKARAS